MSSWGTRRSTVVDTWRLIVDGVTFDEPAGSTSTLRMTARDAGHKGKSYVIEGRTGEDGTWFEYERGMKL